MSVNELENAVVDLIAQKEMENPDPSEEEVEGLSDKEKLDLVFDELLAFSRSSQIDHEMATRGEVRKTQMELDKQAYLDLVDFVSASPWGRRVLSDLLRYPHLLALVNEDEADRVHVFEVPNEKCGLLYADVSGYSPLMNEMLPEEQEVFASNIRDVVSKHLHVFSVNDAQMECVFMGDMALISVRGETLSPVMLAKIAAEVGKSIIPTGLSKDRFEEIQQRTSKKYVDCASSPDGKGCLLTVGYGVAPAGTYSRIFSYETDRHHGSHLITGYAIDQVRNAEKATTPSKKTVLADISPPHIAAAKLQSLSLNDLSNQQLRKLTEILAKFLIPPSRLSRAYELVADVAEATQRDVLDALGASVEMDQLGKVMASIKVSKTDVVSVKEAKKIIFDFARKNPSFSTLKEDPPLFFYEIEPDQLDEAVPALMKLAKQLSETAVVSLAIDSAPVTTDISYTDMGTMEGDSAGPVWSVALPAKLLEGQILIGARLAMHYSGTAGLEIGTHLFPGKSVELRGVLASLDEIDKTSPVESLKEQSEVLMYVEAERQALALAIDGEKSVICIRPELAVLDRIQAGIASGILKLNGGAAALDKMKESPGLGTSALLRERVRHSREEGCSVEVLRPGPSYTILRQIVGLRFNSDVPDLPRDGDFLSWLDKKIGRGEVKPFEYDLHVFLDQNQMDAREAEVLARLIPRLGARFKLITTCDLSVFDSTVISVGEKNNQELVNMVAGKLALDENSTFTSALNVSMSHGGSLYGNSSYRSLPKGPRLALRVARALLYDGKPMVAAKMPITIDPSKLSLDMNVFGAEKGELMSKISKEIPRTGGYRQVFAMVARFKGDLPFAVLAQAYKDLSVPGAKSIGEVLGLLQKRAYIQFIGSGDKKRVKLVHAGHREYLKEGLVRDAHLPVKLQAVLAESAHDSAFSDLDVSSMEGVVNLEAWLEHLLPIADGELAVQAKAVDVLKYYQSRVEGAQALRLAQDWMKHFSKFDFALKAEILRCLIEYGAKQDLNMAKSLVSHLSVNESGQDVRKFLLEYRAILRGPDLEDGDKKQSFAAAANALRAKAFGISRFSDADLKEVLTLVFTMAEQREGLEAGDIAVATSLEEEIESADINKLLVYVQDYPELLSALRLRSIYLSGAFRTEGVDVDGIGFEVKQSRLFQILDEARENGVEMFGKEASTWSQVRFDALGAHVFASSPDLQGRLMDPGSLVNLTPNDAQLLMMQAYPYVKVSGADLDLSDYTGQFVELVEDMLLMSGKANDEGTRKRALQNLVNGLLFVGDITLIGTRAQDQEDYDLTHFETLYVLYRNLKDELNHYLPNEMKGYMPLVERFASVLGLNTFQKDHRADAEDDLSGAAK